MAIDLLIRCSFINAAKAEFGQKRPFEIVECSDWLVRVAFPLPLPVNVLANLRHHRILDQFKLYIPVMF